MHKLYAWFQTSVCTDEKKNSSFIFNMNLISISQSLGKSLMAMLEIDIDLTGLAAIENVNTIDERR